VKKITLLLLLAALLAGCGGYQTEAGCVSVDPGAQLLCLVEDRKAAEELAGLYGIELVDYDEGIALFYTEEDPRAVIAEGREKGWRELSLNTAGSFMESTMQNERQSQ
jgi:hypothetical protein